MLLWNGAFDLWLICKILVFKKETQLLPLWGHAVHPLESVRKTLIQATRTSNCLLSPRQCLFQFTWMLDRPTLSIFLSHGKDQSCRSAGKTSHTSCFSALELDAPTSLWFIILAPWLTRWELTHLSNLTHSLSGNEMHAVWALTHRFSQLTFRVLYNRFSYPLNRLTDAWLDFRGLVVLTVIRSRLTSWQ